MNAAQLPLDGYVRVAQLLGDRRAGIVPILPISRTTLWRLVKQGELRPVKIGARSIAFRADDVRELMERIDSGNQPHAQPRAATCGGAPRREA